MSDLVGNPEDRFSHDEAQLLHHAERIANTYDSNQTSCCFSYCLVHFFPSFTLQKVLRSILSHTPSRSEAQRAILQCHFKPVIDTIILKCTDGNRKTSQLSVSTINELAKNQQGELAVGRDIENPGMNQWL